MKKKWSMFLGVSGSLVLSGEGSFYSLMAKEMSNNRVLVTKRHVAVAEVCE
jgi:hypothetical protein